MQTQGIVCAQSFQEGVRLAACAEVILAVDLEPGNRWPLRQHLAHVGTPVVGDERYGIVVAGAPPVIGHFLHASRLALTHPRTGVELVVEAPLPADRARAALG